MREENTINITKTSELVKNSVSEVSWDDMEKELKYNMFIDILN